MIQKKQKKQKKQMIQKKRKKRMKSVKLMKQMVRNQFIKKVSTLKHLLDLRKNENVFDEVEKHIQDWNEEDFIKGKQIKFVRRFENLPSELKSKMKVVFLYKPMMMGGCYYNSLYLSTLIDGVEKVDGFVSGVGKSPHKYKKYKDYGNGVFLVGYKMNTLTKMEKLGHKVFGSYDKKRRFIYDEKTNKKYSKHSWNRYGDIHFDVTLGIDWWMREGKDCGYDRWFDYVELPPHLTPQPTDDEKKTLLCFCDYSSFTGGCKNWVLNRGVINPKIFQMIGFSEKNGGYQNNIRVEMDEEGIHHHQMEYLELGNWREMVGIPMN